MSPDDAFVHLHVHSDFSWLDGMGKPAAYVERAKQLGQPAIAITDHGHMAGAPEFYAEARKLEVEPILGSELYFVPNFENLKAAKGSKHETDSHRYHVTVLAKGAKGYSALSELSTATQHQFYYKPICTRELLEQADMQHLVVLSGCANSILSKLAMESYDAAAEELLWWQKTCPNFYIELMHHETEFDWSLNSTLFKLAKRHGIPYVITNDPHFVDEGDCNYHDALLAVSTNATIDNPDRLRFDGSGYWLKSAREMAETWKDYRPGAVKRGMKAAGEIAFACRTRIKDWEKRSWHIPHFPGAKDSYGHLEELVHEALEDYPDEYHERAAYELEVIKRANLADFLLITRDIIQYARRRGIPTGPGRGSVCGSLVAFLIGITKVDSVRYNLLFERFLNPDRPSMPDIDMDFGQARRKELFGYVAKKYGAENVIHVATFQRKKLRGMINALGKAHGVGYDVTTKITKQIPEEVEGSWRDSDEHSDELFKLIGQDPILGSTSEFVDTLKALAGIRSGVSQHPAGVIIAPQEHEIRKHVPLMFIASSKNWVAQYDLEALDHLGYLKEDLLGLRTLDTIAICVELIKEKTGEVIDPDSWVPDEEEGDAELYAELDRGYTAGVFQMEGPTNARGIQQIGCTKFEDIVSATALFRTGPILAGFPEQFVENRAKDVIVYEHPELERILGSTEGVILYQEQVMEIGAKLANFDMSLVDEIKDMVKKKDPRKLAKVKPVFLAGCKENRVPPKLVKKLWHDIEGYVGYAFNRAHAVAYSLLSYQTLRLRHFYPLEFYSALLRTTEDKEKRQSYLRDLLRRGYQISPPDINLSAMQASPEYDKEREGIRFGLQDFAGLGERRAKVLVNTRPRRGFTAPEQVADLIDQGTYRILADGGALRGLGVPSKPKKRDELLGWNFRDRVARYRDKWERFLDPPEDNEEDERTVTVVGELVSVTPKTTKSGKPYRIWVVRWDNVDSWKVMVWGTAQCYHHVPQGVFVRVTATWQPAPWQNVSVNSGKDPVFVWDISRWRRANQWSAP